MTEILAIDLGKFTSVACRYCTENRSHSFKTLPTVPSAMYELIVEYAPDRIVIEIGAQSGWLCDIAQTVGVEIQVVNTNHDAWRWKNTKRKTDRDDALKLARLSHFGQLELVHVPDTQTRQWRSVITYRHTLVARRTAIKNSIRSILDRQGLRWPSGRTGWTKKTLAALGQYTKPIEDAKFNELWMAQVELEYEALVSIEQLIKRVETKLDSIVETNQQVRLIRTIPGVGPRLAEILVAVIDDPKRFKNAKQVGSYIGLVPRQYESGMMSRQGRITCRGNRLLRAMLVEVAWLMQRYNAWFRAIFEQVCRKSKSRRKIAAIATARRLLVCCWAMLRDQTTWKQPSVTIAA